MYDENMPIDPGTAIRETLNEAMSLLARYRNWHDELDYWAEDIDNAANRDKVVTRILILIEAGPMSDPATWPRR